MEASPRWSSSRYIALLAVLSLHAVFFAATIIVWRNAVLLALPGRPTEVFLLPSDDTRENSPPPPLKVLRDAPLRPPIDAQAPIYLGSPITGSEGPDVNWPAEAHRAAEAAAEGNGIHVPSESDSAPSGSASLFPTPQHRLGDQVNMGNGDTMIFTSNNCYQIVHVIPTVSNAINNGMGTPTYCLGGSREARGDLLKNLPAYKKIHPEQ